LTRVALFAALPSPTFADDVEAYAGGEPLAVDLGARLMRVELGEPIATAPRCVGCRNPASLEVAGSAVCRPCLADAVEVWLR